MKTIALIALLAVASPAFAQNIDNDAVSGSESNSQTYGSVQNNIQTTGQDRISTTAGASIGGFAGSFSPDYCSGTAGGSVGVTGWGLSMGGPKVDDNCQRMRRVERFGQLSAHAAKIGQTHQAKVLLNMAIFEVCRSTADTVNACLEVGLVAPSIKEGN